jgi:esterase
MNLAPLPWHSLRFRSESLVEKSLNLALNETDSDTTVLFLHGVLRNWRTFHPLLSTLNPEARLAALDFRGHGASDPAPGAYFVRDYVEDATKALEHIANRRNIVYGHSLGAMVAMATAAEHPGLVDAIVLEDPPFSTMGESLTQLPLHRFFAGLPDCLARSISPDSLFHNFSEMVVGEDDQGSPIRVKDQRDETARRFSAESLGRMDPDVLPPIVEGVWLDGFDFLSLARKVRCPIVMFQSDENAGGMLSHDDARALKRIWKGRCELIRLDGVGHNIHWARPATLLEEIRNLLQPADSGLGLR